MGMGWGWGDELGKRASGLWSKELPGNCRVELTASGRGSALLRPVGEPQMV